MFHDVLHLQQLSSCVGSNSCGIGSPVLFGATAITSTNVAEAWLGDDMNGTTVMNMTGSNQGMYNSYAAISTYWTDTTAMDNLRAADITDSSVAGSTETISGNVVHTASSSTFNA
jgi:hypothetical protein